MAAEQPRIKIPPQDSPPFSQGAEQAGRGGIPAASTGDTKFSQISEKEQSDDEKASELESEGAGKQASLPDRLGALGDWVPNNQHIPISAEPITPKSDEILSTKERPIFRVVKPDSLSTKESPQVVSQLSLINSEISTWKRLKNDKPPVPDLHVVNPSGKRKIGRKTRTGYEILRQAFCVDCGKERRLTAGYISATQLIELEREDYETKAGIIRNILRKKQRAIDGRLHDLRCAGCESGRQGRSLRIAEAS